MYFIVRINPKLSWKLLFHKKGHIQKRENSNQYNIYKLKHRPYKNPKVMVMEMDYDQNICNAYKWGINKSIKPEPIKRGMN